MKSIHLQGIGDVPAVPASALEPGMVRQYNYGATATILSVFRVSEKTLSLVENPPTPAVFILTASAPPRWFLFCIERSFLYVC